MKGQWLNVKGGLIKNGELTADGSVDEYISNFQLKYPRMAVLVRSSHFVLLGDSTAKPKRLLLWDD
ncbi:hypothetical protein [Vibrio sp. Hal054]|uniref:hypothetical protein n=1 Tax=Vibrio sp. Hal054 TaxID=3035158 RepID=UPI00301D5E21